MVDKIIFKNKFEEAQKKLAMREEEFKKQLREANQEMTLAKEELIRIANDNANQINALQQGELNIQRVELNVGEIKIKHKNVYLEKYSIWAPDDKARQEVLDNERALMKKQILKEFKKQITDLEANVLAYQDLLMTKELEIQKLEEKLRVTASVDESPLKLTIESLQIQLKEKMTIIEDLRTGLGGNGWC